MYVSRVKQVFREKYKRIPRIYLAPGRINLIGEHTDYNEGFVLPAAISKHVVFAIEENQLNICRFHAMDLNETFEVRLDDLSYSQLGWPNYLMGVVQQFQKRGHDLKGFDCVVTSDIPIGAGLSSSAALESGLAVGLNDIFHLGESTLDIIKLAQKAENEFVGVNCGIMDQFASVLGKKDHVFRLDCRSLEYEYFPLQLKGNGILLVDTRVKHSLAGSEYNTRRKECETGVRLLSKKYPEVISLRDVSLSMLQEQKSRFDPKVFKRCDYVVREIARVTAACDDLKAGRIFDFGRRMYETHEGLREDYEVSCVELDFLVDFTRDNTDVLGARMMGGGFGGCTINILKEKAIPSFEKDVAMAFTSEFDHPPLFYHVRTDDGVISL